MFDGAKIRYFLDTSKEITQFLSAFLKRKGAKGDSLQIKSAPSAASARESHDYVRM